MNHSLLWLTLLQRGSLVFLIAIGLIYPTHSHAQIISTVAGTGVGYSGDGGPATVAKLTYPNDIAVDGSGNLYIVDTNNQRIRKISSATGVITTVAGSSGAGSSGDGGAATAAKLNYPNGIAVDGSGNLYIADTYNHRIRKVTPTGTITTVAGTSVGLNSPAGVAVDGLGNLYIAATNNQSIRKVSTNGVITTVAGTNSGGEGGYSGDGGVATAAQLNYPSGVAVDGSGNFYISDTYNSRIRKVVPALTTTAPVATINPNQIATVRTAFFYTVNGLHRRRNA